MKLRKVFMGLFLLVLGFVLFTSCDEIKQVISDQAAPIIEDTVNECLGLTDAEEDKKFKLPEAKRYENFVMKKSNSFKGGSKEHYEEYGLDVIEPKVTFSEYLIELNERLDGTFTQNEIYDFDGTVENGSQWVYVDETNTQYTLYFERIVDESGNDEKWTVNLLISKLIAFEDKTEN